MSPVHCTCDPDRESVNLKIFTSKSEALNFQFGDRNIGHCVYNIIHWMLEHSLIIVTSYHFFNVGDIKSFATSVFFLLLAVLATNAISLYWLIKTTDKCGLDVSVRHWVLRDVFHFILLGTIWRYAEHVWLIVTIRRKRTEHEKLSQYLCLAEQESALLNLMSSYFGSAPQLILQVCLLSFTISRRSPDNKADEYLALRIITILLCLISTARAVSILKDSIWKFRSNRTEPSTVGIVIRFMWHFFSNLSRALAFGLFATAFPVYTVLVCLGHWIVATFWLFILQLNLMENLWEEIVFKPLIGVIYLFHYFKVQQGPTLVAGFIYYSILTVEGIILVVFWAISLNSTELWVRGRILAFSGYFGTLIAGFAFMAMYYVAFHPTRNRVYREAGTDRELNYLNASPKQNPARPNSYEVHQ